MHNMEYVRRMMLVAMSRYKYLPPRKGKQLWKPLSLLCFARHQNAYKCDCYQQHTPYIDQLLVVGQPLGDERAAKGFRADLRRRPLLLVAI